MEVVIIVIVIVVIVFAFVAKKNQEENPSYPQYEHSSISQQDKELKMEEALQQMASIGVKTLTSIEMNRAEKEDLMSGVMESIRTYTDSVDEETKYVYQIMRESYAKLQETFSFNESFCAELKKRSDDFERQIKEGTIQTYGWDELIDLVEREKLKYVPAKKVEDKLTISFAVKGLQYRDEEAQDAAYSLEEGDDLVLEKEPDNEYDKNAIKVLTIDGYHIGYVEGTKSKRISQNLDKISSCHIKKITQTETDLYIYGLATFKA